MFIKRSGSFVGIISAALVCAVSLSQRNGAFAQTAKGTAAAPRVAVFAQPGFPYYGVNMFAPPEAIAIDLRAAGLAVDLLDMDALALSERLNTKRYAAVVMPYGNSFPQAAFANLKRFHQGGGSLITTGIPFTHPVVRSSAKGWTATPGWGTSARLAMGTGRRPGTNAFYLRGSFDQWAGVASSRFAVQPGDAVSVSAIVVSLDELGRYAMPKRVATVATDVATDELLVRFYDRNSRYLEQKAAPLNLPTARWKTFQSRGTAPANAAFADLAVQVRRSYHPLLVSEFAAEVGGKPAELANADLTKAGDDFTDLGHDAAPALFGAGGIGVGGFAALPGKEPMMTVKIPANDPMLLKGVLGTPSQWPGPQGLNTATLPAGVRVLPAIGTASRPLAALVVHTGGAFKGAVDAWTYRGPIGEREDYETRQIIARGTIAALAQRNLLSAANRTVAFRKLDKLPRPTVYANLTLPTPTRQYATFQPKMRPPARHLYVADARKLSSGEKLLLTSLQGLVNRRQPRIYFLFDDDDKLWLDEMQRQKETDEPMPVADPWSLVETFRSEFKGVVICDPTVYASPCVAVSLSGADDLLVARTPELAARVKAPVQVDLRGKFKNNVEAYRYLRTTVFPRLDPFLTISLDPVLYDRGSLDQIIAAKGSAFWITGPKSQGLPGADQMGEMEEIKKLFAQMPLGAVVRGFWWHGDGVGLQEDAGVALGGRFGKVTLVSDYITNLSVHSGVPATKLVQKPRPPAPAYDPKKVYLAFTMSDGDNLCTWRGYFRRYFDDPVRGTFPVGWGMSPALIDLAPAWARWYYENATPNDEFICDVSGVAYMYPSSWGTALKDREGAFRFFYRETENYMERMDMKTLRLMDVSAKDIAHVGPLLPRVEFLLPDYGIQTGPSYADFTYTLPTGQPAFRAITNGQGPQNLADQIRTRAGKGRPAFVNAFIWNWGSSLSDLKKVLELLGPDYVAVTPSQLNELYRESKKRGALMSVQSGSVILKRP